MDCIPLWSLIKSSYRISPPTWSPPDVAICQPAPSCNLNTFSPAPLVGQAGLPSPPGVFSCLGTNGLSGPAEQSVSAVRAASPADKQTLNKFCGHFTIGRDFMCCRCLKTTSCRLEPAWVIMTWARRCNSDVLHHTPNVYTSPFHTVSQYVRSFAHVALKKRNSDNMQWHF